MTVFGQFETTEAEVNVCSHGSRHESAVPILAYNSPVSPALRANFDLVAALGID